MNDRTPRPAVQGIVETSLYVDDLTRSARFYQDLFGFPELVRDERLCALAVREGQVLLLFRKGESSHPGDTPGGTIPPHDGEGELHIAFAMPAGSVDEWQERLSAAGIDLESTVRWPRGGTSLYFRDPDNHSIELATPGTWEVY
ncbi:MAG: VOC family protein [Ignavibacteria bacterium]|nr:VOC family protein [Ignavibacteria bacterium]